MNSISKPAIVVVAIALVIVIGLIAISANMKKADDGQAAQPVSTVQPTTEPTAEPTAEPTKAPEEEAPSDAQASSEMYEGALAGLTEEEIGKLAMAEEQHSGGETGDEIAEEDGTTDESVAGIAD